MGDPSQKNPVMMVAYPHAAVVGIIHPLPAKSAPTSTTRSGRIVGDDELGGDHVVVPMVVDGDPPFKISSTVIV